MPLGEEVVNDYRFLELSLRAHPASFLRADLARRGIIRNEELRAKPSGARVTVSGLVTIRQRPGTAHGVIFMTIEDETASPTSSSGRRRSSAFARSSWARAISP